MIAIHNHSGNAVEQAQTIKQLFVPSGPIKRASFHSVVQASLKHHTAIRAAAFQRLLPQAGRAPYVRALR